MRCEDFPCCGHGSPLVCLTARAANMPDDELEVWLTRDEYAALEEGNRDEQG